MRLSRGARLLAVCLAAFSAVAFASEIAAGRLLIAKRDLTDPNFAETVILLTSYDREGAMGLILTRPVNVRVSRVFPEIPKASGRRDHVLAGGPVQRNAIFALVRSQEQFDDSKRVLGEVYLATSRSSFEKAIGEEMDSSAFRVYAGYSGWGPRQLDREMEMGAWAVLGATPDLVFDPDPEGLWFKLIKRTELSIAQRVDQPVSELYSMVSAITRKVQEGRITRIPHR
jgi:putative transcriptional regulator